MDKDFELLRTRYMVENAEDWRDMLDSVPFIEFPSGWNVKIIPPFGGAMARFLVRCPDGDGSVSVYLDTMSRLGSHPGPYWEVYPFNGDVFRCHMQATDELINAIQLVLEGKDGEQDDEL